MSRKNRLAKLANVCAVEMLESVAIGVGVGDMPEQAVILTPNEGYEPVMAVGVLESLPEERSLIVWQPTVAAKQESKTHRVSLGAVGPSTAQIKSHIAGLTAGTYTVKRLLADMGYPSLPEKWAGRATVRSVMNNAAHVTIAQRGSYRLPYVWTVG